MDTLDCIKSRRSIRKYLDIPVEFEKIGNVLDAGRLAPSAGNLQDWKFILVTEPETIKSISEACLEQYWMQEAPVHIVVCCEHEKSERHYGEKGENVFSYHNCAAALQNMLLAAHSQGLGSCWVGGFDDGMLRRCLGIPDSVRPQAVLTIGYPDERVPEPPKFTLENVTFIERWGNRIRDLSVYTGHYAERVAKAIGKGKAFIKKISKKIQG